MKLLKNKLIIPIFSCFLAIITIFSLYSLPKAKASETSPSDIFVVFDTSFKHYSGSFSWHYSKLDKNSTIDLTNKKIYFNGSLDYYIVLYLENFKELYINYSTNTDLSLKIYDSNLNSILDFREFYLSTSFLGFFIDISSFLSDTLKIQDIKYFSKTTNEEVSSTNISIYVSNVDCSNFTYVEGYDSTYFYRGMDSHYLCTCHPLNYFDENFFPNYYLTRSSLVSDKINFNSFETYDVDTSNFLPLEKGVDLRDKTIYFSSDYSKSYTVIYLKDIYIEINTVDLSFSFIGDYNDISMFYENDKDYKFAKFSFSDEFPLDVDLVVQDIKHFTIDGYRPVEINTVDYDIILSPFSVHDFYEVDEVPATETSPGVQFHLRCNCCGKFFNIDGKEVSEDSLIIPIKTDKPNNDSSIDSGDSNGSTNGAPSGSPSGAPSGASCSSASIYGIFGILIVFSFVAFAIRHINKRKKSKRK